MSGNVQLLHLAHKSFARNIGFPEHRFHSEIGVMLLLKNEYHANALRIERNGFLLFHHHHRRRHHGFGLQYARTRCGWQGCHAFDGCIQHTQERLPLFIGKLELTAEIILERIPIGFQQLVLFLVPVPNAIEIIGPKRVEQLQEHDHLGQAKRMLLVHIITAGIKMSFFILANHHQIRTVINGDPRLHHLILGKFDLGFLRAQIIFSCRKRIRTTKHAQGLQFDLLHLRYGVTLIEDGMSGF